MLMNGHLKTRQISTMMINTKRGCHSLCDNGNVEPMVKNVNISAGLRIGFWNPSPAYGDVPFNCVGHYSGPPLGDRIPGASLQQELMEGTLKFRVGVLFRPDLGKHQCLETILILQTYIPEMFEYEDWEAVAG